MALKHEAADTATDVHKKEPVNAGLSLCKRKTVIAGILNNVSHISILFVA